MNLLFIIADALDFNKNKCFTYDIFSTEAVSV